MTTMITENPQLSKIELSLLKSKVEANSATAKDLENLDYFLGWLSSSGFLLQNFKEKGINSYEEFIVQRNKPSDKKNPLVEGYLYGIILGAISTLEQYLNTKQV